MRRIVSVFVAAAGVGLLVGGPVAAETASGPQSRSIYQATYRARGADALFTTEGPGGPAPGEIVTDTYVIADTGSWASGGARIRGPRAAIFQIRFTVTEDDEFVWISDTSGIATGRAVTLSVAPRLGAATLKAAVVLETCTPGDGWDDYTCTPDDQPTTLEMKWTATGRAVYGTFHDHYRTRGENVIDRFQGTTRRATSTGRLGSMTLTGLAFAAINDIKSRSLWVGHLPE